MKFMLASLDVTRLSDGRFRVYILARSADGATVEKEVVVENQRRAFQAFVNVVTVNEIELGLASVEEVLKFCAEALYDRPAIMERRGGDDPCLPH